MQDLEDVFRVIFDWIFEQYQDLQDYIPTVSVQLVLIGSQSAVVLVIRYAIIVVIIVARVPFTVLVMVGLVGIGHVGTVVQVVLMAILVNVLVVVALISHQVVVDISLVKERSVNVCFASGMCMNVLPLALV